MKKIIVLSLGFLIFLMGNAQKKQQLDTIYANEKMNLALKKKILTMQTLANQEVLPEKTQKEKKKGWWK
jgi:hypothetical protein